MTNTTEPGKKKNNFFFFFLGQGATGAHTPIPSLILQSDSAPSNIQTADQLHKRVGQMVTQATAKVPALADREASELRALFAKRRIVPAYNTTYT